MTQLPLTVGAAGKAAPTTRKYSVPRRVTTLLLCGLVVLGVYLRFRKIADPNFFTFDEEMFVTNAARYLVALPDQNDHPPVGKLVMAVGLLLFGYDSLGWRFAALWFGLHTIVISYFLVTSLFKDRRAGFFAAAFVAGDGFFIAYSRVGLMDGVLTCVVLWTFLAAVTARRTRDVWVSVVLCALAMSIKWCGAFASIPAATAIWTLGRAPRKSVAAFVTVPVFHALIWMAGLAITHEPWDPVSTFHVAKGLFWHHVELGSHINGLASPWYSWLVLYHPIIIKLSDHGIGERYSSSAGNVILWATSTLLVIGFPLVAALDALVARFRKKPRRLDPRTVTPALCLACGWLAMLFPWMVGRGKYTFSYHYMPSYGFALLLVAASIAWLERRKPVAAAVFVGAVTLVSLYFVPVWGEFTITRATANHRLLFGPWQP